MDLDTENRIAAILLKEAAELRRQAQMEGALAYLRQPTIRNKPNSRFLTATVRGVQQANRAVEVSEMWRLREKQLELDKRIKGRSESSSGIRYTDVNESRRSTTRGHNEVERERSTSGSSSSSRKRSIEDLHPMEDEGLKDDEVDEFLHSRTKRGRGAVGSRMDETGPYLPSSPDSRSYDTDEEPKKARVLLGPEKPLSLKYNNSESSSDDESLRDKKKKSKSKRHSKKHKSKDRSRDKKKMRKEKKSTRHRYSAKA